MDKETGSNLDTFWYKSEDARISAYRWNDEIKISVSDSANGTEFSFKINDKEDMQQLSNFAGFLFTILHEYREKRFKELGYSKPNADTVTAGDLIGLKRQ